jgi:hypothetical protein
MNIYDLTQYVNQDVDDTFEVEDIVRWFNKAIASYNLLSPITTYPMSFLNDEEDVGDVWNGTAPYPAYTITPYPLDDTFMLGVALPFISASIRGQESSMGEKQMFLQEFMMNARLFKNASNVPYDYLRIKTARDLEKYQMGENVYVSDMSISPWAGDWGHNTTTIPEFKEAMVAEFYAGTGQTGITITTARVNFLSGQTLSTVAGLAGISGHDGKFYTDTTVLFETSGDNTVTSSIIIYLKAD